MARPGIDEVFASILAILAGNQWNKRDIFVFFPKQPNFGDLG